MGVTITFDWRLEPETILQAAADGLNAAVEFVANPVTKRTPLESGDLRQSMTVHHANAAKLEAGITFNSVYARYQHELAASYRTTAGTSSHYLSGPWIENQDVMRQLIAQTLKGAFGV